MALRGSNSESNLTNKVHPALIAVIRKAASFEGFDIIVTEGFRTAARQLQLFNEGKSKIQVGGKHNLDPSHAVDIVPFKSGKADYQDVARMRHMVFFIKGIAAGMGINLRLGADWDGDFNHANQTFHDVPHMELKSWWDGSSWRTDWENWVP